MTGKLSNTSNHPRTLVLSMRNIFGRDLYRCPHFEFEDLIAEIDHAEIVAPEADPKSRRNLLARRFAFHGPIRFKADVRTVPVHGKYDLLMAVVGSPRDLLMVDAVSHILDSCAAKVCLVDEIWVKQMHEERYFIDVLKKFDFVALYYSQSVTEMNARIGRPCFFVPPGIDAVRFNPYIANAARSIDVYSVGRRSQVTHDELLRMVGERDIFYLYDSISGTESIHARDHRALFSTLARRSKYFIVNPGLIDRPEKRGSQLEIGNRYFEGAAAGAIMIGEIPSNGQFERLFDWPDAVMRLPYNTEGISRIIDELEAQPEQAEKMRRTNVEQALRRHDWVYRWETILRNVGIEPLPELEQRKRRLSQMADSIAPQSVTGTQNETQAAISR